MLDNRGSILLEHKVIMVAAITLIFGVSGLLFTFLKDYTNEVQYNVNHPRQESSFRSVIFSNE
ncbi:hypothetical protein P9265_14720 [Schinkia azotoformans]|uniref:hypothetical protein n=1 Tax=Schinkia azotoformans TaxID=1454 RepID=UPI002E1EF6A1|nr:hypothetical protein [Schinkia azotoformans]